MSAVTVNISIEKGLLADIDAEAKREARSRSELLREAARLYVQRQRRWKEAFALGDRLRRTRGLTEADVDQAVEAVRRERKNPS